ncbi:hypothetical protein OSB04_019596 [Centaurea solstitialis]|uniref:Reverse transcriptase zinc-binding domain-containing protein n=1 Tax=Centaurea solstitialis TaxID=347529 RepID=A0AA38SYA4_9ASTR|nr:hypothetical protein OSB04_019596 [Centaurea solstitialis]
MLSAGALGWKKLGDENKHKILWIAWDKVINRKEKGPKIGSLRSQHFPLLAKWWWWFKIEEKALWRRVINAIQGTSDNLGGLQSNSIPGGKDMWMWGLHNFERVKLDILATKENISKRRIVLENDKCVFCNNQREIHVHLLVHCSKTTEVRNAIKVSWDFLSENCNLIEDLYNHTGDSDYNSMSTTVKDVGSRNDILFYNASTLKIPLNGMYVLEVINSCQSLPLALDPLCSGSGEKASAPD